MNTVSELWAIINDSGNICMSRGGSSTKQKIMVYESKNKAERALKNSWTKQVINEDDVQIKCVYKNFYNQ